MKEVRTKLYIFQNDLIKSLNSHLVHTKIKIKLISFWMGCIVSDPEFEEPLSEDL